MVLVGSQYDWLCGLIMGVPVGIQPLTQRRRWTPIRSAVRSLPRSNRTSKSNCRHSLLARTAVEAWASIEDSYGDRGEWTFTGKKLDYATIDDLQTWTLKFTTPDYEAHTAKLYVMNKDEQYYAWFEGKEHELPAQSLTVNDDQVTLKMAAETREGSQIKLVFRGTATGDQRPRRGEL